MKKTVRISSNYGANSAYRGLLEVLPEVPETGDDFGRTWTVTDIYDAGLFNPANDCNSMFRHYILTLTDKYADTDEEPMTEERHIAVKEEYTMKNSEIMNAYYDELLEAVRSAYETVARSNGRLQVGTYLWEDGEIETLTDVQGSSMRLYAREMEPRRLIHVTTIFMPGFDIWDFADGPKPADPAEAEVMEEGLIQWYLDEGCEDDAIYALDSAIEDDTYCEAHDY